MFRRIMDATWDEVVEIVRQVPRSHVTLKASPNTSPREHLGPQAQATASAAAAATPDEATRAPAAPSPAEATLVSAALAAQEVGVSPTPLVLEEPTASPRAASLNLAGAASDTAAVAEIVPPLEVSAQAPLGIAPPTL